MSWASFKRAGLEAECVGLQPAVLVSSPNHVMSSGCSRWKGKDALDCRRSLEKTKGMNRKPKRVLHMGKLEETQWNRAKLSSRKFICGSRL